MSNVLRPSSLEKLHLCGCYTSKPMAGKAAARGTMLDRALRDCMESGDPDNTSSFLALSIEDRVALRWALDAVDMISSGTTVLAQESDCAIEIPHLPSGGTADLIFPEIYSLGDLKSGLIRDYSRQMASYALGLMHATFAREWACHLIFLDQRAIITHRFTYEQAEALVLEAKESYHNPAKRPTPNEYCGWCALQPRCKPYLDLVANASEIERLATEGIEGLLDQPQRLGKLLSEIGATIGALELFQGIGDGALFEAIQKGAIVDGWKVTNRKGNEYVDLDKVTSALIGTPHATLLPLLGKISGNEYRKLMESLSLPVDESLIARANGSSFLAKDTKKKKKPTTVQD